MSWASNKIKSGNFKNKDQKRDLIDKKTNFLNFLCEYCVYSVYF